MPLLNVQMRNRIVSFSDEERKEEVSRIKHTLEDPAKLSDRQVIEAWAIIAKCYEYDKALQLLEEAYLRAIEVLRTLGDEKLLGEG